MDTTQIILGLLTIALSGVVSGIVTFQLNSRREHRQLKRQKLENLYESFRGFTTQLSSHWIPYISVMMNNISYNTALDMTIKSDLGKEKHLQKLEMLTSIYFPILQTHLNSLIEIRNKANEIMHKHKEIYRNEGPHPSNAANEMALICEQLEKLEIQFTAAIREEAEKLKSKLLGSK